MTPASRREPCSAPLPRCSQLPCWVNLGTCSRNGQGMRDSQVSPRAVGWGELDLCREDREGFPGHAMAELASEG